MDEEKRPAELSSKIKSMKFMKRKEDAESKRKEEVEKKEHAQRGHWKVSSTLPSSTKIKFTVQYDHELGITAMKKESARVGYGGFNTEKQNDSYLEDPNNSNNNKKKKHEEKANNNLNSATTITTTTSAANSTESILLSTTNVSEEGVDFAELFGNDIDWANVNLGELAEQWRQELGEIEEENIRTLMDINNKSQSVLPALLKSIEEVSTVDALLNEYCERLRVMGSEIQQIEELNRGLNIQTANQQSLLSELDSLLERISLPEGTLEILEKEAFDVPGNIPKFAKSAVLVHRLVNGKFTEDGLGSLAAVQERIGFYKSALGTFIDRLTGFFAETFSAYREKYCARISKKKGALHMGGFDEIVPFLEAYSVLISGLRILDVKKHGEMLSSYQTEMGTIFGKEFTDFIDNIRSTRLIKRSSEDRNYLFSSLTSSSSATATMMMTGLTRTASSISGQARSKRAFATIDPFELEALPLLEPNEHLSADQCLHYLLVSLALLMEQQQSVSARIFYGLDENCSDEHSLKLVDSMTMGIFAGLDEILSTFTELITKSDNSYFIIHHDLIYQRIPQFQDDIPVLAKILTSIKRRLLVVAEGFINEQTSAIDSIKFSARKRSGIFPFVSTFPIFIEKMENTLVGAVSGGTARELLNKGYEKITLAIFRSLDALAVEAERGADEKERINASVMNIQNGNYLVTQLDAIRSATVETSLRMAKSRYDKHLAIYSTLSLKRFFPRVMDFFDGMMTMLENTPAEEVSFHAAYNKSSAKKILSGYAIKDIRKGLDAVHQRVVKHFDNDTQLKNTVWRAVQEQFLKNTKDYAECINRVYPGTDVLLPCSIGDVQACFAEIH